MKKVGILYDNISGNTGDQAIGVSVRQMLDEIGVDYEELVPGRFNPNDYPTIIIGGGHLLRPCPDFFYDKFRVPGKHILNCCGIVGSPDDLQYLNDYLYVTVRSNGDKQKLSYLNREVAVVPCTTMLLKDLPHFDLRIQKPSIGVQLWEGIVDEESFVEYLSNQPFHIYFLPITHYNRDFTYLERLNQMVGNSTLLPILRPEEIFTVIGNFDYFISSSLHGAVFAYVHNVPFVLFCGEDKRQFFMEDRKLDSYLFRNFDELHARFEELQNNKPHYSTALANDFKVLQEHKFKIKDIVPKQVITGAEPVITRHKSRTRNQQAILQERNFQVHYLQNQVKTLGAQAKHQFAQISSLETSLQEKVAQISSLETSLQEKVSDIANLERILQENVSHIANLETSLQENISLVSHIPQLEASLQKKVSRTANLERSLQKKVSDIANLETSLQEKISDIADLEASFQEKDAHIAILETSLQEKAAQISNFNKSRDERVAKIHRLESQMQQIQHSIPMQLANRHQRIVEKLLRPGTSRRHYYELGLSGIRIILNEGWRSFWWNYKRYRGRGKPVPTRVSDRDLAVIMAQPEEKVSLIDRHVTVVIPTRNAGPDFEFTLEHLTNAKGIAALETIVVDSGSTDCTIELAEKYSARVFKIRPDEFNHGLTRNFGATQAGGDYVLFMVQDAIPMGDRWLYEMVRVMENDSRIAATTCRQVPRSDADLFACFSMWNHYRQLGFAQDIACSAPPEFHKLPPLERRRLAGLDNVCCLVKRPVFDDLKFKEMSYAEDLDLGLRLLENGYKASFLQSAAVVHSHNRTATYVMKRSYVEAKLLPTILCYQPPQFSDEGNVEFMFGSVMTLYAALNTAVQSVTSYSEPVDRLCSMIKSSLRENFSRGPEGLREFEKAGGQLDVVFDEIRGLVGEASMTPTTPLIHQYLAMLDTFTSYLNVYTSLEDKKGEFVESLYKLFAISSGTAFGSHFLAASKRGEQNKPLAAVDAYLSEGV